MQRQLQRCKSIVSSVLLQAGEARGETAVKTTLNKFLDQVAADFRATLPVLVKRAPPQPVQWSPTRLLGERKRSEHGAEAAR